MRPLASILFIGVISCILLAGVTILVRFLQFLLQLRQMQQSVHSCEVLHFFKIQQKVMKPTKNKAIANKVMPQGFFQMLCFYVRYSSNSKIISYSCSWTTGSTGSGTSSATGASRIGGGVSDSISLGLL